MSEPQPSRWLSVLKRDLPSSVVVFLVALPLCLGIAVASGAPPLAGLVSGIVGGLVIGALSGSSLAVSGPAAGLAAIVLMGIDEVGYEGLLLATVLAGGMQIAFGLLRAGIFAYYFPTSVIKGMLAAIGVILILKQIPHAVGWDSDYEGDLDFFQPDHRNTFSELLLALEHIHLGAVVVSCVGLVLLFGLERSKLKDKLRFMPPALIVVLLGVAAGFAFAALSGSWAFGGHLMVNLPTGGPAEVLRELHAPAFSRIAEPAIWKLAVTIAIVASLETLLCLEAMDKLDPDKRVTPTNRELIAQGVGNALAGLLGGLPVTAVIVRGAANVHSGAKSKASSILHGMWLLIAVLAAAGLMNLIPLAALAAVLLHVGYKLASPTLIKTMFKRGAEQFVPFAVTIVAVVLTDLLKGVGIGMAVAVFFLLRENLKTPFFLHMRSASQEADGRMHIVLQLSENVSFLNKASVSQTLAEIPDDSIVEIDGTMSQYIHPDVVEIIKDFEQAAGEYHGCDVIVRNVPPKPRHDAPAEPNPVKRLKAVASRRPPPEEPEEATAE
ncbi:MAG: SulP family inorganic anion transporter [Sandaracinaceae bacterium]